MKWITTLILTFAWTSLPAETAPHMNDAHAHEEGDHHPREEAQQDEHGHHDEHEESSQVGPDKAVTAWEPGEGFRLSQEAAESLDLKTIPYSSARTLPAEAFVYYQDKSGVYRQREGWFSLVEGAVKGGRFTPRDPKALRPGDAVVTRGSALLRVAELDLAAGETSGHAH